MSNYSDLLKNPQWQKKRLEIFQRDNWECQECNEKNQTLHVHHKTYEYGKMPWDYTDDNFITMCEGCHGLEESFKLNQILNYAVPMGITRVSLWRLIGAVAFLKKTNIDSYEELVNLLNKNAISENNKGYNKFLISTYNNNG